MTAEARVPSLVALVPVEPGHAPRLGDTLVSLAAQGTVDFEVAVTVAGEGDLTEARRLVGRFEAGFAARVGLHGLAPGESPLDWCVRTSRARFVAVIRAGDVPFGHWAETLCGLIDSSGGGVVTAVAATQLGRWMPGSGAFTTTDRPRCEVPSPLRLAEVLGSPPDQDRAWALPRGLLAPYLAPGLPPEADEWAARIVGLAGGPSVSSPEVLVLRRTEEPAAAPRWTFDPHAVLEQLARRGLVLEREAPAAPGPDRPRGWRRPLPAPRRVLGAVRRRLGRLRRRLRRGLR